MGDHAEQSLSENRILNLKSWFGYKESMNIIERLRMNPNNLILHYEIQEEDSTYTVCSVSGSFITTRDFKLVDCPYCIQLYNGRKSTHVTIEIEKINNVIELLQDIDFVSCHDDLHKAIKQLSELLK